MTEPQKDVGMSDDYEEYRQFIDSFSKLIDPDDQVGNMQKTCNKTIR